MITDGNPTSQSGSWNNDATGSGGTVNVYDIEGGVASANLVKSEGARVIGIGIGDLGGTPPVNLVNISGQNPGDDYYTGGIGDLETILRDIALQACGGTVIVEKQVPTGPSTFTPTNGWAMGASIESGAGSFVATPQPPVTSTLNGNPGLVEFKFTVGTWTKTVRVFETPQAGFDLVQQSGGKNAVCMKGTAPVTTTNVDVGSNPVKPGVELSLGINDAVRCVFQNAPRSSLTIVKDAVPDGAQDFAYTASGACLLGLRPRRRRGAPTRTNSNTKVFTIAPADLGAKTVDEGTTRPVGP